MLQQPLVLLTYSLSHKLSVLLSCGDMEMRQGYWLLVLRLYNASFQPRSVKKLSMVWLVSE